MQIDMWGDPEVRKIQTLMARGGELLENQGSSTHHPLLNIRELRRCRETIILQPSYFKYRVRLISHGEILGGKNYFMGMMSGFTWKIQAKPTQQLS